MTRALGQVEIAFEYSRHLGPRFIHGAVRLRFDSLQPYSFSSHATWPGENYEAIVRIAVEEALRQQLGDSEHPQVTLLSIAWDPIASCPSGFTGAARAATLAAFAL